MSWNNRIKANIATRHTNKTVQVQPTIKGYAYVVDVLVGTGDAEVEGAIRVKFADDTTELVYPVNYHTRHIPVRGELVPLYDKGFIGRLFYGPPMNIHNYPSHNSPSSIVEETPDYKESTKTNPYKLYNGDSLFEGRFGQSIRFSQTLPNRNPWSEGSKQGNSVIILSSGQRESGDTTALLEEDLDKDAAVLVLLEDGKLKYEGATNYEGHQAVLISDRVHIKARKENVDITATKDIHLEDEKWKATITEILDIIEDLAKGGNATANGNTLPFINILEIKLKALRKSL